MSKLTHRDLLSLGQKMGYPLSDGGLCAGFSGMLMQAILAKDKARFWARLELISTKKGDFDLLIQQIKEVKSHVKHHKELNEVNLNLLEILAFYEGMELYLKPFRHKDLFNDRHISQESFNEIFLLTRPAQLESDNLSIVFNKDHAFNKMSLLGYVKDLAKIGNTYSDLSIIISSSNHSIHLEYDPHNPENPWIYVDINDFRRFLDNPHYYRELTHEALVDSLFISFSKKAQNIVLNTTMFVVKNNCLTHETLENIDSTYTISSEHVTMYDAYGAGLLYIACQNGNIQLVEALLQQESIEVNKPDKTKYPPLYMACQNGYGEIIEKLLAHKDININKAYQNGATLLYLAYLCGHMELFKVLLHHPKIDVNQKWPVGETLLYTACEDEQVDLVKELLKHPKIDVNQANPSEQTPLYIACQNEHIELVTELLKHRDIDIDKAKNNGNTPFFLACSKGNMELLQLLLENGSELNTIGIQQYTPLMIACEYGMNDIVRKLLSYQVDLSYKNIHGNTAIDIAFSNKNDLAKEMLLNYAKTANLALDSLMSTETKQHLLKQQSSLHLKNSFFTKPLQKRAEKEELRGEAQRGFSG